LAWKYAKNSTFLAFMPNAVRLYPIFGGVQRRANRIGVYLANDFQSYAKESGYNRLPGGWRLYLHVHYAALRMADVVLARGRKNAEIASSYSDDVHQTVPMGHMRLDHADTDRTREHGEDGYRILYVGKVRWRKGMVELLRAFEALCERRSSQSFWLDVVGDGPDLKEVQSHAEDLESADRIHFSGWVDSTDQLEKYWRRADVAVMPSSKHKEGVPRAIDEALNRGIPVVATAIGGIPREYTNGEVYLVEPGNVAELIEGFEEILSNRERRKIQVERGKARIHQWREYNSAGHQHGEILANRDKGR
jgi:glycosyltransferase involved in cell wall biosynthesis